MERRTSKSSFSVLALTISVATLLSAGAASAAPQQQGGGLFDGLTQIFGGGQPQRHNQGRGGQDDGGYDEENDDNFWGQHQGAQPGAPGHRVTGQEQDQAALTAYLKQPRPDLPIIVTRTEWTDADEVQFGNFVHQIGQAVMDKKCGTVTSCMQNPKINMYAQFDPPGLLFYSDCAKYPYFLREYFAYHNGLPFGFVNGVQISARPYASVNDKDAQLKDARLDDSPYGNIITSRGGSNLPTAPGREVNYLTYSIRMFNSVSTRTNRVGPLTPNYDLSDVYPVKINRDGIAPGTLVFANGHAMIVWNVQDDGQIQIMDGHPGAFVQYHPLDSTKLQRSRPDQGFGFYRFRPLRAVGAKRSADGEYYGGRIVTEGDDELYQAGKYSLEQWFGAGSNLPPRSKVDPNAWKTAYHGVGFFDYLVSQLREANSTVAADDAVTTIMSDICDQIEDRMKTVGDSITAGVPLRAHPAALPANLFGASDADWEAYSTPGGDGRLKDSVRNVLKTAVAQFRLAKSGSRNVLFSGTAEEFQNLLRQRLAEANKACSVSYKNSVGKTVRLTMNDVLSRLNKMSFDPYMCPEKSWGASGAELRTCRDADSGDRWYNSEQYIRNTVGKQDQDDNMVVRSLQPITLQMLQDTSLVDQPSQSDTNLGTRKIPVMNLDAALASPTFLQQLQQAPQLR